jgi:hypothetical protein
MPDPSVEQPVNRGFWQPNIAYNVGDVVFVNRADNSDLLFDKGYDQEVDEPRFMIAYRMIAGVDVNTSGNTESSGTPPNFPAAIGRRTTETNNEITWESFDNRRPLQSIRLTFRFHDKASDNMRQLSLVIPMTDVKK